MQPFHELEFLVVVGWVCKPILVIFFARARPQANQQTNIKISEIKYTSYTYEGQLSTDKDHRKFGRILGHMLIILFGLELESVLALTEYGIKINS